MRPCKPGYVRKVVCVPVAKANPEPGTPPREQPPRVPPTGGTPRPPVPPRPPMPPSGPGSVQAPKPIPKPPGSVQAGAAPCPQGWHRRVGTMDPEQCVPPNPPPYSPPGGNTWAWFGAMNTAPKWSLFLSAGVAQLYAGTRPDCQPNSKYVAVLAKANDRWHWYCVRKGWS
jgi:hypothetical protein